MWKLHANIGIECRGLLNTGAPMPIDSCHGSDLCGESNEIMSLILEMARAAQSTLPSAIAIDGE